MSRRSLPRATAWLVVGAVLVVLGTLASTDHRRDQRDVLYGGIDGEAEGMQEPLVGASTNRRIMSQAQMLAQHTGDGAKPAKCTGLMNCVGQAYANKWLAKQGAPWTESSDEGCPGCDGGEDAIPPAPAAGDTSLSAVVQALQRKLAVMRQSFRVIEDNYEHGPARKIDVNVDPRGPRGFTGPDGPTGPPGKTGPKGGMGPPGHKGPRGPRGPQGPRGRTGAKGMTGAKGRAGKKGPRGKTGNIGKTGYAGPKGSRGLPGAAGSPGANGKQGIPGPAGRDSGAGAPGPAGFRGPQGFAGKNGKNGAAGAAGPPGQKGKPGRAGASGNVGRKGARGVGPPVPTAVQLLGAWPRGGSWTSDMLCKSLGVKDNLGGKCKKLCPRCKDSDGFKLVNSKGLRWGGYTFDDKNIGPGSVQARNICALARYGQGGKVSKHASDESFGKVNFGVQRPHWYGNCNAGKAGACCANYRLLSGSINWRKTAHGNSCSGNSDKAGVTKEILCVYDAAGYAKYNKPRKPYAKIYKDRRKLISNGKKAYQRQMRSRNGRYYLELTSKGVVIIYRKRGKKEIWRSKPDRKVGHGPFSLKIIGNGALAVVNNSGKVVWSRGSRGKWFRMGNRGSLRLYGRRGRGRKLLWDTKNAFRRRRPSKRKMKRNTSTRRSRRRRGWKMRVWTGNHNMRRIPRNYRKYKLRGTRWTHYVNLRNNKAFTKKIKATPHDHFVWEFNGRVWINKAGKYTLCTKSDDGSRIKVDGRLLVNNDGLHGPKEKCRARQLSRGHHRVITWGFQRGGGAYQTVYYKGPDTRGRKRLLNGNGVRRVKRKRRGWRMRVWKGAHGMRHIPKNYHRYKRVGTRYMNYINLKNNKAFQRKIRGTPHDHFVWEFSGKLRIRRSGKYTLCTKSDDGSRIKVNGRLLVNNDGLHGPREKCGTKYLRRGRHRVLTYGFQRGGGAYQTVRYKGPDTKNRKRYIRTRGYWRGRKRKRRGRWGWRMRVWTGNHNMKSIPKNYRKYKLKGTRYMRTVNLRNNKAFQRKIRRTPHDHFVWEFKGRVRVRKTGTYTLCTKSDDGSRIKVDGRLLVNNDGLHGPKEKCAALRLKRGRHWVVTWGFQRGGGAYQTVYWKGPDTKNRKVLMKTHRYGRRSRSRRHINRWKMRVWTGNHNMRTIPRNYRKYKLRGTRYMSYVNLKNNRAFKRKIRRTPHDHFVWEFNGRVRINKAGTYTLCTKSDDGSRLKVDGKLLVNNDGLHGPKEKCAARKLSRGRHRVVVWGFQRKGGAYQTVYYKGPDTKNRKRLMRPSGFKLGKRRRRTRRGKRRRRTRRGKRRRRTRRGWKMRVWTGNNNMRRLPGNYGSYKLKGTRYVTYVNLKNNKAFKNKIRRTPHDHFVWEFRGKVRIRRAGRYTICSRSDDGSKIRVDGSLLVNNDGLHGPKTKCRTRSLNPGKHRVVLAGFQRHGGAYQTMTYKGPDTKGKFRYMKSRTIARKVRRKRSRRGFRMRVWKSRKHNLRVIPRNYRSNRRVYKYIGSRVVGRVSFRNNKAFTRKVRKTPHDHFVWEFRGKVRINRAGTYEFCSRSDDGSRIKIDGRQIVNNDGLHGPRTKCGRRNLSRGRHRIVTWGFQRGGGAYQTIKYKGPDTRQRFRAVKSVDYR